jgi:AcrR family transcriptional regulator
VKSTKDRLADSFLAYLGTEEYSKIKISTVTRDSGVDRQTFYYWFKDSEDVLRYLLYREFHPDPAEGFWPDDLNEGRRLFLAMAEKQRDLVNAVLSSPLRDEAILAWYELMVWGFNQLFDDAIEKIEDKVLRRRLETERAYFSSSMAVATISLDECWLRGGMFDITKEYLMKMDGA